MCNGHCTNMNNDDGIKLSSLLRVLNVKGMLC